MEQPMCSLQLVDYKTFETVSCVYKITHSMSDKTYIGRTNNLKERARKHFQELVNGKHKNQKMQNMHNKYGDMWSIDVIYVGSDSEVEELEDLILSEITLSESLNCHTNSAGGSKNQVWTDEQRARHSIAMKNKPPLTEDQKARHKDALRNSDAVKKHMRSIQSEAVLLAKSPEVRAKAVRTRAANNGGSFDFFKESREATTEKACKKLFDALDWAVANNKSRADAITEFGSSWGSLKKFLPEWEAIHGKLPIPNKHNKEQQ